MTWVTKVKRLSPEHLDIIPEDWTIDRGENQPEHGGGYFVLFEGQPFEVSKRVSGLMMKTAVQKKLKKHILKALADAKDADTVDVYTYKKEC
jgi:hypothetical protein